MGGLLSRVLPLDRGAFGCLRLVMDVALNGYTNSKLSLLVLKADNIMIDQILKQHRQTSYVVHHSM